MNKNHNPMEAEYNLKVNESIDIGTYLHSKYRFLPHSDSLSPEFHDSYEPVEEHNRFHQNYTTIVYKNSCLSPNTYWYHNLLKGTYTLKDMIQVPYKHRNQSPTIDHCRHNHSVAFGNQYLYYYQVLHTRRPRSPS